jgi:hypothetical protein
MRLTRVRLHAPARSLPALAEFYARRLDLETLDTSDALVAVRVGEARLEFVASAAEPFYHVALLAPGNRWDELLVWARERMDLLPDPESGEVVFDFHNWNALACYFHDPAQNIVELIAHRGIGETRAVGSFSGRELLGVSELGLVGDRAHMAAVLADELGLELWDGSIDEPGHLAFVGVRGRTLILSQEGRGWLPTGRPAETHPVEAVLTGSADREVVMEDSLYRIRQVSDAADTELD